MLSQFRVKEQQIASTHTQLKEVRAYSCFGMQGIRGTLPLMLSPLLSHIQHTPHTHTHTHTHTHPAPQSNSAVVAELQRMQSEPSPLVAAEKRRAEKALDTEKFEKLIENLQVG